MKFGIYFCILSVYFYDFGKNHMKIHYCHHHHGFHRTCLFGSLAFLQVNCWMFPQVVCIGLYFYLASSEKVFQKTKWTLVAQIDAFWHVNACLDSLWNLPPKTYPPGKTYFVAMFFVCATIGTFFRCFEKSTSWKPGVNIRNQDFYYPNNNLDDFWFKKAPFALVEWKSSLHS